MSEVNPYQPPNDALGAGRLITYPDGAIEVHSLLTVEDQVAFNLHYLLHTPSGRRLHQARRLVPALLILPWAGVLLSWLFQTAWPALVAFMAAGTWWWSWPSIMRSSVRRNVQSLLQSSRNLLFWGDQWVAVTPREVRRRTAWCHVSVLWAAVERLDVTDQHVFIFIAANAAFVVPLRDFPDAAAQLQFVEAAREFQAKADFSAPIAAEVVS
jgi:hypothetical protein